MWMKLPIFIHVYTVSRPSRSISFRKSLLQLCACWETHKNTMSSVTFE
jgi:hypothetical protein